MAEYEDVISLVLQADAANKELGRFKKGYDDAKAEIEARGIKITVNAKDFEVNLNKLVTDRIKAEKAVADEAIKQSERQAKAFVDITKRAYKAIQDENAKKAKQQAAEEHDYDVQLFRYRQEGIKEAARYQRLVDKEYFRYQQEGLKEIQAQKVADIKQQALLQQQAAKFSNIFTPGGIPLPVAKSTINAPAALRTGAGAAAALGSYPAAGALYASANAMQVLGVSAISTSAALGIFAPALAAVGGAILGYKFVEWGAEFSRELAKMSTLLADTSVTGNQFADMLDKTAASALKISAQFNVDKIEVIKAFKEALSSGIDASDLERFTSIVAQLSTATNSSLKSTASLLTSLKDAYQLSIGEVVQTSDLLFNSINVGKLEVQDFNAQFGRLASVGAVAGLSLKDLNAGVDLLTRQGIKTSNAITAMVTFIDGLQNPSAKAKKALDALGITTGEMAFRGRDLITVMEELKTKTGGSGDVIGTLFDESRARRFVSGAVRGVNLMKNEILPTLEQVGTTAVASGRALNNLADQFGIRITAMSNAVTAASAKSGGWLNTLIFGSEEDRQKRNKQLVDEINAVKDKAKSVLDRGISDPESVKRTVIAKVDPSLLGFDEAMTNSTADQRRSMAKIKIAIEDAYAEAKDSAVVSLRKIDEELQDTLVKSMKTIDDMSKGMEVTKLSKIDTKEINSRATDEQKQRLDDLASEIEDQKEALEIQKERLRIDIQRKEEAFSESKVYPAEDALRKAVSTNDTNAIPGLKDKLDKAREEFKAFTAEINKDLSNDETFNPFLAKIYQLTLTIETMRARIAGQDDRGVREAKEAATKKEAATVEKDTRNFNTIVERLYKEDTSNYEKAQKERENIFKRINKEIENEAKRSANLQATIQNNILKSQADQHSDDPGAQVRIGRKGRDTALEELKNAAGAGKDRNAFDAAVKKYQEASELVKNAMRQIDATRAERNYRDDESKLLGLDQQFNNNFQDNKRMEAMSKSARDNSVRVRTPGELAKDASAELALDRKIEQVVVDVKVKMDVTGNMSDKTKAELVELVTAKVQQAQKNRNPTPSNYDKRTRDDSKVTSVDE